MSTPEVQTIKGPHGMESRINWTLLGKVLVARDQAPLANNLSR